VPGKGERVSVGMTSRAKGAGVGTRTHLLLTSLCLGLCLLALKKVHCGPALLDGSSAL